MLRAMIVDDEAPARSELRYLLERTGRIESITEAESVRAAIEALQNGRPDVIFLDISMPKANGLQLAAALRTLKNAPAVVFVTAYAEHALEAFDVEAVDYLLKPVDANRLLQAIDKVQSRMYIAGSTKVPTERILVEKGGRKILMPIDQICYIEAKDDYSCIYTESNCYLSTTSLAQLENKLSSYGFFRVHRSHIVNLDYVKDVETVPNGSLQISIRGIEGKKISVSRRRVVQVKRALGI